jgi:hypothetical protein
VTLSALHSFIHSSMVLEPFVGSWALFSFFVFYTVDRTHWTGDQPAARPLLAHMTAQTQNKLTHTFMPRMGFEPTILAFKRVETVHALDRAVTVIGLSALGSHDLRKKKCVADCKMKSQIS